MIHRNHLLLLVSLSVVLMAPVAQARVLGRAAAIEPTSVAEPSCAAAPSCAPVPVCAPVPCCEPKIVYRHACGRKVCCGCPAPIQTVLTVKHPCTGYPVTIPVCLPGCCGGDPMVDCYQGIFCRDVVRYDWCCGFSVKVVFCHSGTILVTYIGH